MEKFHQHDFPTPGHSTEVYIDFLMKTLGASRQEILEVTRRSGISARRIAEYLVAQQAQSSTFNDDE